MCVVCVWHRLLPACTPEGPVHGGGGGLEHVITKGTTKKKRPPPSLGSFRLLPPPRRLSWSEVRSVFRFPKRRA
jgi:hypothetical protein